MKDAGLITYAKHCNSFAKDEYHMITEEKLFLRGRHAPALFLLLADLIAKVIV